MGRTLGRVYDLLMNHPYRGRPAHAAARTTYTTRVDRGTAWLVVQALILDPATLQHVLRAAPPRAAVESRRVITLPRVCPVHRTG